MSQVQKSAKAAPASVKDGGKVTLGHGSAPAAVKDSGKVKLGHGSAPAAVAARRATAK